MAHVAQIERGQFGHRQSGLHHQPQNRLIAHRQPRQLGRRRVLRRRHGLKQRRPVEGVKHQRIHLLRRRHGGLHIHRIDLNPALRQRKVVNFLEHAVVAALGHGADMQQPAQLGAGTQRLKISAHIVRARLAPVRGLTGQQMLNPADPQRMVRSLRARRQAAFALGGALQSPGFKNRFGIAGNG